MRLVTLPAHDVGRVARLGAWLDVLARDPSRRVTCPEAQRTPDGILRWMGPVYPSVVDRFVRDGQGVRTLGRGRGRTLALVICPDVLGCGGPFP